MNSRSLLFLGSDDLSDLVSLGLSTLLGAESGAGDLDSLLLFVGVTDSDELSHLTLVGGQAGHLSDDLTHGSDALVESTLADGLVDLESVGGSAWLGHDETLVETDE